MNKNLVKWVIVAVVLWFVWQYVQSKGGLGNLMGADNGKKGKQPASQMTG